MIKEVSGDILLTDAQVIACGLAPGDHMDAGLAMALRRQWPALARDFRHYCHTSHPKLGEAWVWSAANGQRIATLLTHDAAPGQHGAGRPGRAHVESVNHALRVLRALAESEPFTSLALPKLSTGSGGLSWEQVRPLIVRHLGELTIPVTIYTAYHQGQPAAELRA
jgi:O-acetyl-ADP-ribose deacetylase (regulator of RNase III)